MDKSYPSVIVFSETKRCQHPQFTQKFQKAKKAEYQEDDTPPAQQRTTGATRNARRANMDAALCLEQRSAASIDVGLDGRIGHLLSLEVGVTSKVRD